MHLWTWARLWFVQSCMPHHSSACALFPRNFLHCILLPPLPQPFECCKPRLACRFFYSSVSYLSEYRISDMGRIDPTVYSAHCLPGTYIHMSTNAFQAFFCMYPFCVEVILSARMLELIMCAITNPLYDILPLCVCVWLSILHIKSSRSCSMNLYHLCGATEGTRWMGRTIPETETVGIGSPSSNESMEAALCYNYIQP